MPDLVIGSDFSPSTLALAEAHVGNVPSPHPELGVHQHLFGWMTKQCLVKVQQHGEYVIHGAVEKRVKKATQG